MILQIACITGSFGKEKRVSTLFSLGRVGPIPGVCVRTFPTEGELLRGFAEFIRAEDPDVFVGYNIFGFDWPYILARATISGVLDSLQMIGRLLGVPAPIKQVRWSSSAYGDQQFDYPDAQGRLNIDVMKEMQREYRLPSYSLNSVSARFLEQKKDDITPRQLFMLYASSVELEPLCESSTARFQDAVRKVFIKRFCHGKVRSLRRRFLNATSKEERTALLAVPLRIVGEYCVQDTLLPILLCERLNLWTTMEALSNCMSVPISYLHSRGQQIKVMAQVYREILPQNLIIPFFDKEDATNKDQKYQGAIVIDAHEGYYEMVALLDFLSLYPTLIIAFNICYTTIVADADSTPDSDCHVLEWEDPLWCPHDEKKRKRQAEDCLCQQQRHRLRP